MQSSNNDRYTALLEENNATLKARLKDKEDKEALYNEKIKNLECNILRYKEELKLLKLRDTKKMEYKIEFQRQELGQKDNEILRLKNNNSRASDESLKDIAISRKTPKKDARI